MLRRLRCRVAVFMLGCGMVAGCGEQAREAGESKLPSVKSAALGVADCPPGYNVIQGTNLSDTLNGTSGNDCILGLGGGDLIYGYGGNDYIVGGDGDDFLYGGNGADAIYGEGGDDTLQGDSGDDRIEGGDGNDIIYGSTGVDTLLGDAGRDLLNGGDTGDTLYGGADDDVLHGDAANDNLFGGPGDDILDGDGNNDILWGGDGDDVLYGDAANDTLYGEAGDDALLGGAGTNVLNGGPGTDACTGTLCEKPALTLSGCTYDGQCASGQHCISDFGLCIGCVSDQDGDGTCDSKDGCPTDAWKVLPGACGCGASDTDGDGDGTANCVDGCPGDPMKQVAGSCGCGVSDVDGDGDGTPNCQDGCPNDAAKLAAGICGCGASDIDADGDGTANCNDGCPSDAAKLAAGSCGCGVSDADGDGDGTANCNDGCPSDAAKLAPGVCGCGLSDVDGDGDGVASCLDGCPVDPGKVAAGSCGCGVSDADGDADGTADCLDGCPSDPAKQAAGTCGCGVGDADGDSDGTADCHDGCPGDAAKQAAGTCGCGVSDADGDADGTANCLDGCPADPAKQAAGTCGCGVSEVDSDLDARPDCVDVCPGSDDRLDADSDGTPDGCEAPAECAPNAVGAGVYQGGFFAGTPEELEVLEGITCVTGGLYLTGQISLEQLASLTGVAGDLYLWANDVVDLDGLENLERVGGALYIENNAALRNLDALGSLSSVGSLLPEGPVKVGVRDNQSLPPCQVWALEARTGQHCGNTANPYVCAGNNGTESCGALPPDFACVPGAVGPGVVDGDVMLSESYFGYAQYAGVTCITGNLSIYDVSSLAVLSQLQKIGGSLTMFGTQLTNLAGLEQLVEVGGQLAIGSTQTLQDLSALSHLQSLGARIAPGLAPLWISGNASLPGCQAWRLAEQTHTSCKSAPNAGYLDMCSYNTGTGSCGSLPADFACVPGATGPGVYDGHIIPYLSGYALQDLGGVTCVTGDVSLEYVSDVSQLSTLQHVGGMLSVFYYDETDLTGLENLSSVGTTLQITNNPLLTSLHGLEGLRRVGQQVNAMYNPELRDVTALNGLTSIGAGLPPGSPRLMITGHSQLPACQVWGIAGRTGRSCHIQTLYGWEYLCQGNSGVGSCGTLPADFECVPGAQGPGVFDGDFAQLGFTAPGELSGLTCVTGDMFLSQRSDLSELSALQAVGGHLEIVGNPQLTDLSGLENVREVGHRLRIEGNYTLQSLSELSNLRQVGAQLTDGSPALYISGNDQLAPCHVLGLKSQTGASCEGMLYGNYVSLCSGNNGTADCGELPPDFACVPGAGGPGVYDGTISAGDAWMLSQFAGVGCVTGDVIVGGYLEDLAPLSNLQKIGGSLRVEYSSQLTDVNELSRLTAVGDDLRIESNQSLTDLSGLGGLASLGANQAPYEGVLSIAYNPQLAPCWQALLEQQLAGQLFSSYAVSNGGTGTCGSLPPDFACVPGAHGVGVYDGDVEAGYEQKYRGLTCITGDLVASAWGADLTIFEHLQKLGGSLRVEGTYHPNVDGFENLTEIGRQLSIVGNYSLQNLEGLSSLSSLGANSPPGEAPLVIQNNGGLPGCWVAALETQTGETCGALADPPISCSGNSEYGSCSP